jgi:hypothetical protein
MSSLACGSHRWKTASSHLTSDGWVRYQRCFCGAVRTLLNSEPIAHTSDLSFSAYVLNRGSAERKESA